MSNRYFYSTTKMVTRTLANVTLYLYCVTCSVSVRTPQSRQAVAVVKNDEA